MVNEGESNWTVMIRTKDKDRIPGSSEICVSKSGLNIKDN